MIVDAHQHFWTLASGYCRWLKPENGALYRDYLPEDLAPLLDASGVAATILVQAAPAEAETEMLLAIAARTAWVAGVVGWTDILGPGAPSRIARLARQPKLKGLRPTLPAPEDDEWHARASAALAQMSASRLTFDALARPQHLDMLCRLAAEHPHLIIIVDHAANPPLTGRSAWAREMSRLASAANVRCKISGLLTLAGSAAERDAIPEVIATLVELFGPHRLMWGSDWPVLNQAADYAAWHGLAREVLQPLGEAACAEIFGGTARRAYAV